MRVLVLSDVHANREALTAVLADAGACDAVVCLGDFVGYGADPNHVLEWARSEPMAMVRGNHDRVCAGLEALDSFSPTAAAAARWTRAQLRPELRQWLRELPAGPLAWRAMRLAHGSPLDEDEYLLSVRQAAASFAVTSTPVQWFGHTHVQGGFVLSGKRVLPLPGWPGNPSVYHPAATAAAPVVLALDPGARYLLNPGSVGQPRDGDWRAAFALLDPETGRIEFRRVPYDVRRAHAAILAAGLPGQLADRLPLGR